LKPTERVPDTAPLQRRARERADEQARRIPWQRLLEVRNQYIDWQEFYLWVRSILEVEGRSPDWLTEVLNARCPGFLESESQVSCMEAQERPIYLRLEDWIDDHVFGFAKQEGWFNAVTFYAVREKRYQRAQVCWSESVEQWRKARPVRYPSFEEWKSAAAQCDDTAHLVPEARAARESSKRVTEEQLAEAVARYIDWEAFAYWVRPAVERLEQLPAEVAGELEQRCPGFLDVYRDARMSAPSGTVEPWPQMMRWIADHCFHEAKTQGWCDAILSAAQIHPRAIRTQEYCDHCDEIWSSGLPVPYPSFEDWRCEADAYVDLSDSNP
jgi:hypothetical protein